MDATLLIIWAVVGAVIGWLASQIMTQGSYGIQGDLLIAVGAALVGGFLLPRLGIRLGGQSAPLLVHIVNAAIGAVIGTFAGRLVKQSQ
jgi:uncharacterized membrane protein YeaQ/YmgE (transglycosylase-associated protein family)